MIVLTFRRVPINYSTKQKAGFRRYCDTYTSFGRKPQLSSTISSFSSLNLHLLTNRRRYSSHLLPAVRGWLRLYWWWSSGKDATRRDAVRHTTELSRDNYLRDAASDVSVCVWRGGSRCHCLESRVSGERKSTNLTWWQFQSRLLTPPTPHPFHSQLLTISPFS